VVSAPALRSTTAARTAAVRVARANAATVVVAALTFAVSFDGGSYGLPDRATIAIAAWWLVILNGALGLLPRVELSRSALVAGTGLAAFAGWVLLSALWAPSAEDALIEFDRASLYVAVFVLTGLAATRVRVDRWLDGIAGGISAVAVVALASRLLPELAPARALASAVPSEATRLSFPLDYWNGTALLLAIGLPLLLRAAVDAPSAFARAAALGVVPVLGAAVYLTASRGGALVAFIAAGTFVALAGDRLHAGAAAFVGLAGAAAAIGALSLYPSVVDARFDRPGVESDAHLLALIVVVVVSATGGAWAFADGFVRGRRLNPFLVRSVLAAAGVALVIVIALSEPAAKVQSFTDTPSGVLPAGTDPARAHLLSGGGSGRWQFWGAAVEEFRSAPLHGQGAGAFESWWGEHARFEYFVRDAHSLYLETLGDLGVVGLALLLTALGAGVVAGVRLARHSAQPTVVAALFAAYVGYLLAVAIDWMWELTVVTVVGIALLALLVTFRRDARTPAADGPRDFGAGLTALAAAWILLCLQAIPLLADFKVRESRAAAADGRIGHAAKAARAASSLEPWAATPYLQLALVAEQADDLRQARVQIGEAIERDPRDWRLWLVSARLEAKSGAIAAARRSLAHAEALSPRRLEGGIS
jgi:O-antigen ligase